MNNEPRKKKRLIRRGIMQAFLPMYAVKSLSEAKDGVGRIVQMIRTGKPVDREGNVQEVPQEEIDLIESGKEKVLALDVHTRFEYYYEQLGWDEESLAEQKKAIYRSHLIRYSILLICLILYPVIWIQYGFVRSLFTLSVIAYLTVTCIKAACFYTQLEERALWSFAQLRARPNHWLLKRAFWFLE